MLVISLIDAANNCQRNGATAVIVTRAGAQIAGKLQKPKSHDTTAHIKTRGGGWATVLLEEIAVVEARVGT